jgi:hypothetical protein
LRINRRGNLTNASSPEGDRRGRTEPANEDARNLGRYRFNLDRLEQGTLAVEF